MVVFQAKTSGTVLLLATGEDNPFRKVILRSARDYDLPRTLQPLADGDSDAWTGMDPQVHK